MDEYFYSNIRSIRFTSIDYISDHRGVTTEATDPYIKPGPSERL